MKKSFRRLMASVFSVAFTVMALSPFSVSAGTRVDKTVLFDFEGTAALEQHLGPIGSDLTGMTLETEAPLSGSRSLKILKPSGGLGTGAICFRNGAGAESPRDLSGADELWIRVKTESQGFKFYLFFNCGNSWTGYYSKFNSDYKLIGTDGTVTVVDAAKRAADFGGNDKLCVPASFDGYVAISLKDGLIKEGGTDAPDAQALKDVKRVRLDFVDVPVDVPVYLDDVLLATSVPTVDANGVTLDKMTTTVAVDGSVLLTATVQPDDADDKTVAWSVTEGSDKVQITPEGASCSVKGLAAGTAKVKVTTADGGFEAVSTITVEESSQPVVNVDGISLDKTAVTINKDKSITVTATVTPENATNKEVIWSITQGDDVVSITPNGAAVTIAGLKKGTAKVKAVTVDGAKEAFVEVTVLGAAPADLPTKGIVIENFNSKDPTLFNMFHNIEFGRELTFADGGMQYKFHGGDKYGQFGFAQVEMKYNWTNGKYLGFDVKNGDKQVTFSIKLILQDDSEYLCTNTEVSKFVLIDANGVAEEMSITDGDRMSIPAGFTGKVLVPLTSGPDGQWKRASTNGGDTVRWNMVKTICFCDTSYEEMKDAVIYLDNLALYGDNLKITGDSIALKVNNNGGNGNGGGTVNTGDSAPVAALLTLGACSAAAMGFTVRRRKSGK